MLSNGYSYIVLFAVNEHFQKYFSAVLDTPEECRPLGCYVVRLF
jgi:hypothetical protein